MTPKTLHTALALAVSVAALVGCNGAADNVKPDNASWGMNMAPAPDPVVILDRCAPWLPAETIAVAVVDVPYLLNLYRASGLVPEDWDASAMNRDLGDYSAKKFGVDITKATWAAVAFSPEPEFAVVFLGGDFAAPVVRKDTRVVGNLTAYRVGEDEVALVKTGKADMIMYVFEPEHLEAIDAVRQGKVASLAKAPNKANMVRVLKRIGANRMVLVGQVPDGPITEGLQQELQMVPPKAGAVGLGERTALAITGDPASLTKLRALLIEQRDMLHKELGAGMAYLDEMDAAEGMLMILAYHLFEPVGQALTPVQKDDMLTLELEAVGGLIAATALLGGASSLLFMGSAMAPPMMEPHMMEPKVVEPIPAQPVPEPTPAPPQ